MIVIREDGYYVAIEYNGETETIKGPFDSRDEAEKEEEKCKYFMMVSQRKVEGDTQTP